MVDDDVPARFQPHFCSQCLVEFVLNPELFENRLLLRVQLDLADQLRLEPADELHNLAEFLFAVDPNSGEIVADVIAQHAFHQVQVAMQQRRGLAIVVLLLDLVPGLPQKLDVHANFVVRRSARRGAHDESTRIAAACFTHQPPQPRTIFRAGNLPRNADVINRRHVHQEAPGQRHVARDSRTLLAQGFLRDLHHHVLPRLQHLRNQSWPPPPRRSNLPRPRSRSRRSCLPPRSRPPRCGLWNRERGSLPIRAESRLANSSRGALGSRGPRVSPGRRTTPSSITASLLDGSDDISVNSADASTCSSASSCARSARSDSLRPRDISSSCSSSGSSSSAASDSGSAPSRLSASCSSSWCSSGSSSTSSSSSSKSAPPSKVSASARACVSSCLASTNRVESALSSSSLRPAMPFLCDSAWISSCFSCAGAHIDLHAFPTRRSSDPGRVGL